MAKTKKEFICLRTARVGTRLVAPGEIIKAFEDPGDNFMAVELEGPNGKVETGPFHFCIKPCSRHNRTFRPGELWPYFKEQPPERFFAPLEDRGKYKKVPVGNSYELRKVG